MKIIQFFKNLFQRNKFYGRWIVTSRVESISTNENLGITTYVLKNPDLKITYIVESLLKNLLEKFYISANCVTLVATVKKTSNNNKIWYIDVCDK